MGRNDTLHHELMGLPGVAAAEVSQTAGAAPAAVTVRLAPGADARSVGVAVQRVLASHGLRSRVTDDAVVSTPEAVPSAAPEATPPADPAAAIEAVSVEETSSGVAVTVSASDGSSRSESAEGSEDGVARAVTVAVGALRGMGPVRLLWMERREAAGDTVLSVLVEAGDGSRRAASTMVRGSLAHAVARAVWDALG